MYPACLIRLQVIEVSTMGLHAVRQYLALQDLQFWSLFVTIVFI